MAEAAGKWFMEFDNSLIVNNNFVTRIKIPSADTWLKLQTEKKLLMLDLMGSSEIQNQRTHNDIVKKINPEI